MNYGKYEVPEMDMLIVHAHEGSETIITDIYGHFSHNRDYPT